MFEGSLAQASNRGLSRDEFATFLAEAASVVNNTPMWTVPNHPDDPSPLTPAMLLTLRSGPNPPLAENLTDQDLLAYGKQRYRRVQYLAEQFWGRWRKEYLQLLTKRQKWRNRKENICAGDVVLVRDKQRARNCWPMGIVSCTKESADGLVRSANVTLSPLKGRSGARSFSRAITDLVLLIPSANLQ